MEECPRTKEFLDIVFSALQRWQTLAFILSILILNSDRHHHRRTAFKSYPDSCSVPLRRTSLDEIYAPLVEPEWRGGGQ